MKKRNLVIAVLIISLIASMTTTAFAASNYCKTGTGNNWTYSTFKVKGDNTVLPKSVTLKQSKAKCNPVAATKKTGMYYQRYQITITNLTDGGTVYKSWDDSSYTITLKKNKTYKITLYAKGVTTGGTIKDKWYTVPRWTADPTRATWK